MPLFMILSLAIAMQDSSTMQDSSVPLVRATELKIVGRTDSGTSAAAIFRGLIATLAEPDSRVRSSDVLIVALIAQGARRSATLTRVLAAIEASNGIVYIEPGACSHGVRACLQMWMQVSGPNRYLRVLVDKRKADSDVELTGAIGHELQHVIEALSQPSVTDGVKLYNFFRRYAPTDNNRFETTPAINIGNAIRDEVRASQPRQLKR
jgi:hypothetical protein